jgi:transcriptional regulator with PAS, ATPase and Fis domain
LKAVPFDRAVFLYNYPEAQVSNYLAWLGKHSTVRVQATKAELTSPIHFADIYEAADQQLAMQKSAQAEVSILLSPGTPAMQAVWILLGKTRYPCQFYQSSLEQGVQLVDIPFELSMEYLPAAKSIGSARINQLAEASAPVNAAFDNIITRNNRMQTLKAQAQVLAEREVPVLIYGETGTGKELFARAIHNASQRADKPFVPVNCGAIPPDLVDSMLFGHKKGAFTGAVSDKPGVFSQADGGTLFLDEFGELDPSVQVRLLRVLQEGSFTPLGASKEQCVNVRLITATHRNLMEKVSDGTFREDLFYRIAVGVLHLPPLREREGDLTLLAKRVLRAIGEKDSGLKDKKISPEAINIILKHPWRGNVRELQSSLLRAALWCHTDMIQAEDMRQSLFLMPEGSSGIMTQDISQGIDLKEVVDSVARHYIPLALDAAQGKKTRAAQLLGLNNYQTLSNWMEKLDIS